MCAIDPHFFPVVFHGRGARLAHREVKMDSTDQVTQVCIKCFIYAYAGAVCSLQIFPNSHHGGAIQIQKSSDWKMVWLKDEKPTESEASCSIRTGNVGTECPDGATLAPVRRLNVQRCQGHSTHGPWSPISSMSPMCNGPP